MKLTIMMQKERETKGTFRYQEIGTDGLPIGQASQVLGTLYIRKSSLPSTTPQVLTITLEG